VFTIESSPCRHLFDLFASFTLFASSKDSQCKGGNGTKREERRLGKDGSSLAVQPPIIALSIYLYRLTGWPSTVTESFWASGKSA
jgi:hypothetical protein